MVRNFLLTNKAKIIADIINRNNITTTGNKTISGGLNINGNVVLCSEGNNAYINTSDNEENKLVTIKELNTSNEQVISKSTSYVIITYDIGFSFHVSPISSIQREITINNVTTSYNINVYILDLSSQNDNDKNIGLMIDGVILNENDVNKYILINQPSSSLYQNENGLYKILNVNIENQTIELIRSKETDGYPNNDLKVGDFITVSNGLQIGTWVCYTAPLTPTNNPVDIIEFRQVSGPEKIIVKSDNNSIDILKENDSNYNQIYNLSTSADNINIPLNGNISGNKSLTEILKFIDNNFKVIFQNINIDNYQFENFYNTTLSSSTSDI
jgi:hypothetical protein